MTTDGRPDAPARKREHEVLANLSALPGFAAMMADPTNPPEVVICCPGGHRIIRARLSTHNNLPHLAPHPDEVETDNPVASDAKWGVLGAQTGICEEPRCSTLTSVSRCAKHGGPGGVGNDIYAFRVRMRCPEPGCGYEGTHLGSSLLARAAAVALAGKSKLRLES